MFKIIKEKKITETIMKYQAFFKEPNKTPRNEKIQSSKLKLKKKKPKSLMDE